MRKAARYMIRILLIAYIAMIAMLAIPILLGMQVLAVTSGSMEPTIPVGSVVYAQPAAFEDIQVGDIITFHLEKSGTKVTHRVVEKDEELWCVSTQGDANEDPDAQPTSYKNVDGVVRCVIPYLGRIAVLLNEIHGKIMLGAVFILLLALEELLSMGEKTRTLEKTNI